ncbi:MAG: thiolase domain-containing protein [Acidimicrobiales bacterium]
MTRLHPSASGQEPVAVLAIATTALRDESDAVLDELVFDATSQALSEAGVRKHEVGISITASLDAYDGRSISSGLTNAAAGGYLNQSYRVEGDMGQAIIAAAQAIAAGDVELALAVGVYNPEVSERDPQERRRFLQQISHLAFEPHADRPVGLHGDAVLAMHAGRRLDRDELSLADLAEHASAEISQGAGRPPARRHATSAEQVLASPLLADPLRELMMPAESTGAIAVVLSSVPRGRRAARARALLSGWGQGGGGTTSPGQWLVDPGSSTRRAAGEAMRRAGIEPSALDVVELTSATPALHGELLVALGATHLPIERINPSGGARSCWPGIANGGLRLLEAVTWLEENEHRGRALVHSADLLTGSVVDSPTVLALEAV